MALLPILLLACSNNEPQATNPNATGGGGSSSGGQAAVYAGNGGGGSTGDSRVGSSGKSGSAGRSGSSGSAASSGMRTSGSAGTGNAGSAGTGNASSAGTGNAGSSGRTGTAGGSGRGGNAGAGGSPSACADPADLGVRVVGRYDDCSTEGIRIRWSGTGFVGAFKGTGISLRLKEEENENQYSVLLDGTLSPTLVTAKGEATYRLGQSLQNEVHSVEFYRRTEAQFGATTLLDLTVDGGALEAPPKALSRTIEIVGDSISCGYGNEGTSATCSFSADTENHYLSYGALLGRRFNAEVSTVAWSGKGVVSNYNGNTVEPMPTLYDRAIPGDPKAPWDFRVQAQAVIVNLGTNDYSTNNDPTDEKFTTAYVGLLSAIRKQYADAYILCTIGPMLSGTDLATARKNIAAAVGQRTAAGDSQVATYVLQTTNDSPGCDYHPDLATHQAMADELGTELSAKLGW